jgi:hypothetical protein
MRAADPMDRIAFLADLGKYLSPLVGRVGKLGLVKTRMTGDQPSVGTGEALGFGRRANAPENANARIWHQVMSRAGRPPSARELYGC